MESVKYKDCAFDRIVDEKKKPIKIKHLFMLIKYELKNKKGVTPPSSPPQIIKNLCNPNSQHFVALPWLN